MYLILTWISLRVQHAAAEKIKLSRLDYQEPKPQLIEDEPLKFYSKVGLVNGNILHIVLLHITKNLMKIFKIP